MSEIWRPQSRGTYRYWIEAILMESSDKLSDWERKFVDDIDNRLNFNDLTQSQAEKLEQIYVKHTS